MGSLWKIIPSLYFFNIFNIFNILGERFFVMEACFYECEPAAGLYRKFPNGTYNASDSTHNEWQMWKMPIQSDFCDGWYDACRDDMFCATNDGDFFSCAEANELLEE